MLDVMMLINGSVRRIYGPRNIRFWVGWLPNVTLHN